jgi:hypothetical protein
VSLSTGSGNVYMQCASQVCHLEIIFIQGGGSAEIPLTFEAFPYYQSHNILNMIDCDIIEMRLIYVKCVRRRSSLAADGCYQFEI